MNGHDEPERPTRKVSFVVVRAGTRADGLSEVIGTAPDLSTYRADRVPVEASWELTAEGAGNDDLSTIIELLLARVRPLKDRLAAICAEDDTTCLLSIVQYVGPDPVGPGFALEAAEVALLAELNAFVDVDQYWTASNTD